jgi:hypothetical protein
VIALCALPIANAQQRKDKRPLQPAGKNTDSAAPKTDKEFEAEYRARLDAEIAAAASQPTTTAPGDADDEQQLLARRERMRGPSFLGKDPAFLVLPRPAERGNTANELMTPEVREMIEKGLAYLAERKEAEGSWSDLQFQQNTGVTALACLAFMAEGSRPRVGKYGRQIDDGMEFLLKSVQTNGVIAVKGSNPLGPGYENAFSTLALLYASGDLPRHPEVRDVISKSIQAIGRSQKLDGGWRYDFGREGASDMSVTANVLWVLRTAKKAGFTVSADSISKAVGYVERCAMPDGTFRYRAWGLHASPSLGGTGIIALCHNGSMKHPLIPRARDRIAYDYQRYTVADLKDREYCVFGSFYASLAMYMSGDEYFAPWYRKAVKVLAARQGKDGQFADEFGNTVYTTAMALMVLQSPLGYLPIYER